MGWRFLLFLLGVLLVVAIIVELGVVAYAYERLGLSRYWVYAVLVLSLAGSRVNIPVASLPSEDIEVDAVVVVFGVPYIVPARVRTARSIVAVNVGGAVVPCAVSTYLFVHGHLGARVLVAVLIVTSVAFFAARPIPGVGIVVPTLVPPAAAIIASFIVGGGAPAAVAFVSGTIGTVVGADLFHLKHTSRLGAPIMSIGGAGTFDAIFVTGVIAVLFASR